MAMTRPRHRLVLLCLLSGAGIAAVHADEFDAINFRAAVDVMHDDNLFRVPDRAGLRAQSDTITSTLVGVDFSRRFSRQQVSASLNLVNRQYAKHDYLDATAVNYDARWLWAAGSHLTGELFAGRTEAPNSYADIPEIRTSRERNLRVIETQRFGLDYGLHPSWHLIGDVTHQDVRNEQRIFADGDIETYGAGLGVKYTPASGNWLSWQLRQYEGKYSRRPFDPAPGVRFDNEFTQPGHEFNLNWQLTGHSTVTGRLEYLRRKHEHFSDRDFSGWAGQLGYAYQYSAKTVFTVSYLRGLAAFQTSDASYFVSDGVSFGSQWAATDKISVGARLGFSHRQYRGAVVPVATAHREDDGTDGAVDIIYQAARWLQLKAGLMAERRSSNRGDFDFTDRRALFSATALF